ncbi:hypothetical protein J4436_02440 [Candidatus Woesearchaeota archaeon]|nr:hypothetical protein [Candidatus Woesearchaeota archaeon]
MKNKEEDFLNKNKIYITIVALFGVIAILLIFFSVNNTMTGKLFIGGTANPSAGALSGQTGVGGDIQGYSTDGSTNVYQSDEPCVDSDGGMFANIAGNTVGYVPSYGNVDTVTDFCPTDARESVYEYYCVDGYTVNSRKLVCPDGKQCLIGEDGGYCGTLPVTTATDEGEVDISNLGECYIGRLQYTLNGIDTTFGSSYCSGGTTKVRVEFKKDSGSTKLIAVKPYPSNVEYDASKMTVTYCCK